MEYQEVTTLHVVKIDDTPGGAAGAKLSLRVKTGTRAQIADDSA
jgi:hypothetical protein